MSNSNCNHVMQNQQPQKYFHLQMKPQKGQDIFFEEAFLTYSLSPPQSIFQIQKSFAQLSSPKPHYESINRVMIFHALTEKGQREWMNHFVFIQVELDSIDLFYAEGVQGDNATPPQFNKQLSVITGTAYFS